MKHLLKQCRNKNVVNVIRVFNPDKSRLIVFFPGWLSTEAAWRHFLPELSKEFRIEYFESREKPSAQPSMIKCQTFNTHGDDVVQYLNSLGEQKYYVVAASIGASVFLSVVDRLNRKPEGQILIAPGLSSPMSRVSGTLGLLFDILRRSPSWLLYFLRPIFLAIIKRLASPKNKYQVADAIKSFAAANLARVTASARQLLAFELDLNTLSEVTVPTLIVTAKHDSVHKMKDAQTLNDCLPNSHLLSLDTFACAHEAACARKVLGWISEETLKEDSDILNLLS